MVETLALGSVDTLLGDCITNWLSDAALTQLAGDPFIDLVLDVIHLLVSCHLRLVQVVCSRYLSLSQRSLGNGYVLMTGTWKLPLPFVA